MYTKVIYYNKIDFHDSTIQPDLANIESRPTLVPHLSTDPNP